MDIQLPPFNFVTFLLFISFISLLVKAGWKKSKHQRLPPSPWKLPLIGHLHHLLGALPSHRSLTNLAKKYGPIMHLQLSEVSAIVVSSRRIAKDVLKGHDVACANRPESIGMKIMWYDYTDIAFSPYNEYWRQMRKICIMELLSNKNVRAFGSVRVDEASCLFFFFFEISQLENPSLRYEFYIINQGLQGGGREAKTSKTNNDQAKGNKNQTHLKNNH
ncbi:Cytochrome [Abeliophyllum distichum]|uniref:Cytochrome n=1 Tax=Abeliophyllum distichum TaxID=126358 RepID=A0ABD1NXN0_9LAMI